MRNVFLMFLVIGVLFVFPVVASAEEDLSSDELFSTISNYVAVNDVVISHEFERGAIRDVKVINQRFVGQGRCSQVCPTMRSICESEGGTPGRCWCDEKANGVTIGHIVCHK